MNAYILAGGKSLRFGSCKARVEIEGTPCLVRLCSQLHASGLSPWIVSKTREDFVDLFPPDCPTPPAGMLADRDGVDGPLAGIATALEHCGHGPQSKCWILNCDLVEWQGIWNETVFSLPEQALDDAYLVMLASQENADAGAVLCHQPFPGLYDTRSLPYLQAPDVISKRSVFSWVSQFATRCTWVSIPNAFIPRTFNTPDELQSLRSKSNESRRGNIFR